MKERPILFTPENAQKVYDKAKTQTRRILTKSTEFKGPYNPAYLEVHKDDPGWKTICPHGLVGDRLWIRESHCILHGSEGDDDIVCYRGDKSIRVVHCREENEKLVEWVNSEPDQENCADDYRDPANDKWKSAMFMPRYACRTIVEITDIRVERVQDISAADAKAEGVTVFDGERLIYSDHAYIPAFTTLWDSINGESEAKSWRGNPWVWALTFRRIDAK